MASGAGRKTVETGSVAANLIGVAGRGAGLGRGLEKVGVEAGGAAVEGGASRTAGSIVGRGAELADLLGRYGVVA